MDAYDWSSDDDYTDTPAVGIRGITDLTTLPADKRIVLTDRGEDGLFTCNGVRVVSPQYCDLELAEISATRRNNLFAALKRCFQASSYDITFNYVDFDHRYKIFIAEINVKVLN